jgi:hypothetical protein
LPRPPAGPDGRDDASGGDILASLKGVTDAAALGLR